MSIKDVKFRLWEPWKSHYIKNKSDNKKESALVLFVHSIDIIEKVIHKPGFDPCIFLAQTLKLEEAQHRAKILTELKKNKDGMEVDTEEDMEITKNGFKKELLFQKFSKHKHNFFTYQNLIYDHYSCIFLQDEVKDSKMNIFSKKMKVLFANKNKNTIGAKIFCARYAMAIELAKYMESDYFLTAKNLSTKKIHYKKSDSNNGTLYNPIEKYLLERHKQNSKQVDPNINIYHEGLEKFPDIPFSNDVLNSEHSADESLSIGYATVSEFLTMLLSSSFLIDTLVDVIPDKKVSRSDQNNTKDDIKPSKDYTKVDDIPSLSSRSKGRDNSVSESDHEKKYGSKKISDAELELSKYFSEDEINENCAYFIYTHIIPVLFYTYWILKSCVKFCDRITTHQLGPVDPSNRFLTEAGFKGNNILFKKCSDEEGEEILSSMWRNILKLGKRFNMFGVENLDLEDIESHKKIDKTKLSDFDGQFADDNWFSSLGIKKIPKKNGKFQYFYEVPIINYDVTNVMKIINLISSKGCTLLDSQKFRYFMTCFWRVLDLITNSNNLVEYFSLNNGTVSQNHGAIPESLESSMSLFPKYFAVEVIKNKKKHSKNKFIEEDDEVIVVSSLFIHNSETILSYIIEGLVVSDYLHSTFICKSPKLPCANFCENWLGFCNEICVDDNYSQFLKSKFSDIYWNRNQFYGECDNYNTSQKIVQSNPVSNIMMDNRYRHHEICDKICKFYPKEIYDFCIEKITACTNYHIDLRSLFSYCWDIHRLAIIKEPPSMYIKDITEKFSRVKITDNKALGNTDIVGHKNYAIKNSDLKKGDGGGGIDEEYDSDNDDEYELIKHKVFDQSKSHNKEREELENISSELEKERKTISESEFTPHVFKGYSLQNNKNNMISEDVTIGSDIFSAESLLDRALDKKNSYKNALQSIRSDTQGHFLASMILKDDENTQSTSLDTAYFVRKTQNLPVGLIEFNVLQETILYIISFKNTKILNENSINTNILKTEDELEDMEDIIEMDDITMISYPTFDSRDLINEEKFPVYDHLFGNPDTVIDSTKQTTVDNLVKGAGNGTHVYQNKNSNSMLDYWGLKKKFGSVETVEIFDDGEVSEEDDVTRKTNSGVSVTEEIYRSYGATMEDEEFGIDGETYEKVYRDKENYKRRFSGVNKNDFKELKNIQASNMFKKEWPDIMNYDVLQQRSKEEAGNMEFPLTILECSCDIKKHSLFRRSKKDKPCFFMFFNNYYLCDGKNLYSTRFATKIPILSTHPKLKKKYHNEQYSTDNMETENDIAPDKDSYESESDEEYNYFHCEYFKYNDEEDQIKDYTSDELPFTTPYDIGALLGTLIDKFEDSTNHLIKQFYTIIKNQDETLKILTNEITNYEDAETIYNKRQEMLKREEEFMNSRIKMISEIQKNYKTFPEMILNSTLPYKRKFDHTSKTPISKVDHE